MKKETDLQRYGEIGFYKYKGWKKKLYRMFGAFVVVCFIVSLLLSESEFYMKDKIRSMCTQDGDFTQVIAWVDQYRTAEVMAEGGTYRETLAIPVNGRIVQGFGLDEDGMFHECVTIEAQGQDAVYCVLDGEIKEIIQQEQGYRVCIEHGNRLMSSYSGIDIDGLDIGAKLLRGEAFATVREDRMVFGLYHDKEAVDPMEWFKEK